MKNQEFRYPAQWLRETILGAPKNWDIPCKLATWQQSNSKVVFNK